jgi:hypothetical protein
MALIIPKSVGGSGEDAEADVEPIEVRASKLVIPKSVGGDVDDVDGIDGDSGVDNTSSGVGSLVADIDEAFQKIPGAPTLSEFAASFNKPILETLDFLGPDTINALLQVSGSEKRVPTLAGTIGSEGGFMDEGLPRDIVQKGGEFGSLALGIGQLLRSQAAKLPAVLPSESTATGVVRQMGQTAPKTDLGVGVASGAGGAIGQDVGGDTGEAIGSIAGGLSTSIPSIVRSASKTPIEELTREGRRLLKKAAPSTDDIKKHASSIYAKLDESGFVIPKNDFRSLVRDISSTLKKEGSDPDLTPKAEALVKRLTSELGSDKTLTEIDTLRKVAQSAASSNEASEKRLGTLAINKIDDFLDNTDAGADFKTARDLWGRAMRSEKIKMMVSDAESQGSGFENGLRVQARALLKKINHGKERGFSKQDIKELKRVAEGTSAGNVARFLGKFGVLDGVTSRSLTTGMGMITAGAVGGTGAAVAVPILGQMSGSLSQRLTENNSKMALAVIKAGKNGAKITNIYMRSTPKSERSAYELAELLLAGKVPVETFKTLKSPLASDAAIIANNEQICKPSAPVW